LDSYNPINVPIKIEIIPKTFNTIVNSNFKKESKKINFISTAIKTILGTIAVKVILTKFAPKYISAIQP